jgi:16S rRNA (guanine966-N2)-methyltransferase
MRVIGGRSRGRRLAAKLPRSVRPTSDRVRESIFDILGSRGGVEGLTVVDLFCGSGALGLEALSRGASAVTFVDKDAQALAAVRQNLHAVGLEGEAVSFVHAVLPEWLRVGAGDGPPGFDLALCDPPYDFTDWDTLLGTLRARLAVLETAVPVGPTEGWVVIKERRYGGTLVTVAQRSDAGS